ncbi:hypothetical protein ACVWXL_009240 [Bradyrhizobium sp. GM22.5]
MLGIGCDGGERLGRGAEQNGIDHRLVLESNLSGRRRQRENDVEVRHGKEFGLSLGKPLCARRSLALRAMPIATGVVGDAGGTAVVALLDVATEHSRPACRDRAHDAPLDAAQTPGTGLPKRFAVAAEDIRHF